MTLTLTIDFGNDAMQTGVDAARALRSVADKLARNGSFQPTKVDGGKIMDLNGNSVGKWEIR